MRDRSPASQFVRCGYDPISRGDLVDAVSLISRTRWATQCPHASVGPPHITAQAGYSPNDCRSAQIDRKYASPVQCWHKP